MHARVSGLADYYATDETDAIRLGRRIVARLNHRKAGAVPHPAPLPPTSTRYEPGLRGVQGPINL